MNDFNRDLDEYLASRRVLSNEPKRKRSFSLFKRKTKKAITPEEELREVEEQIHELEEEADELDEDYIEEKRESLLARLFSVFRSKGDASTNDEDFEEILPQLDEDLKEVLKISFMWLNHLPPQKMKEFKSSGDFDMFKEVLFKYGLAKNKE